MRHHDRMTPPDRTTWICEQAQAVGFDLCGIVRADTLAEAPELRERLADWLARGYAGEMKYLHDARRSDARLVLEGVRSVIVVALNYNSDRPYSSEFAVSNTPRAQISRYAWGDDYHDVVRDWLENLLAAMRARFEPFEARVYVDTGPVVERVAAKYAGLGWLAKNTCLINEEIGSWVFLGVILTTLDLVPTLTPGGSPPADLCGNCTLCLEACPTQAFPEPYVLDARRCISYLTIELRGSIPEEMRGAMGRAAFGCDICQEVCPWNRKAPATKAKEFAPREATNGDSSLSMFAPELESLANLSQREFSEVFRGSAVKRAKWRGLVRNACVALGNAHLARDASSRQRLIALLERLAASDDTLVAEHAHWALKRVQSAE